MVTSLKTILASDLESRAAARRQKTDHLVRRYRATGSLYSPLAFSEDDDGPEPELPICVYDGE